MMPTDKLCFSKLFSSSASSKPSSIPGLIVRTEAFTQEEEASLLQAIQDSSEQWTARRTRLTKNYGPYYLFNERDTPNGRFRYTNGKVMYTPLPSFLSESINPILQRCIPQIASEFTPNQLHVALYRVGEDSKIRMHNDNKMGELGPYIIGMCLSSSCDMTFVRPKDGKRRVIHLPRRCIYVMSGESHFEWRHGILSGDTSTDRISITLRDVRRLAVEDGLQVKKSNHQPSDRNIAEQRLKDARRDAGLHSSTDPTIDNSLNMLLEQALE